MRFIPITSLVVVLLASSSAQSLDETARRVDQIFAVYNQPNSPGCALGVMQDGNFVYRKGYGMGSLELGVPLSPQSVFYMASVSKQFTAASVALAAEQGFISLDDNIRKYIPEIPDYGHPITLRQMLHHTSGFRDFETLLFLSGRQAADLHSREEMIALIARQKDLNNVPGNAWLYSNTNYFLLSEVLRRATKRSLAEFAAENIFRPLGMAHTRFYDEHTAVVPGRVAAYDPGSNGDFIVDWSTNFDLVGAGGLMSSIDDLLLWDRNFYDNKLGKGTLVKELQTRGVLNNGKPIDYALGLELSTYRGLPVVSHGGALFGYRTQLLRFPEQRFTVACLCNLSSADPHKFAREVADVYLEKKLQPDANQPETSANPQFPDPRRFAGKYLDPRRHFVYVFSASGQDLMAWGGKLHRVGANQFRDLGTGTITFEDSAQGMKSTLEMDGETFFAGQRVIEPHLTAVELEPDAGQYQSTELDATYDLSVEKGSLMLTVGWNPALKLTPVAPDEFDNQDFGTIVLHRNADHKVESLTLFTVNARDISFKRVH